MQHITIPAKTWEAIQADLRTLSLKAGGLPMPAYKRHQAAMLNDRLRAAGQPEIDGVVQGWMDNKAAPDEIILRIGQ